MTEYNETLELETEAEEQGNTATEDEAVATVKDLVATPRQSALITCPADTVFFGGARGGGKTYGCGLLILDRVAKYGKYFKAIFFRRSNGELEDVVNEYKNLFYGVAVWQSTSRTFKFWNGATLKMRFLDKYDDVMKYQGHDYCLIIFDEVTNFSNWNWIERMRGCLRSGKGIPTQMVLSGNPGGPLHMTLKSEFISPWPDGDMLIPDGYSKKMGRYKYKCFIPSYLKDNPYLDGTSYEDELKKSGTPEQVKQWLHGDWNVRQNAAFASLFKPSIHVVKKFRIPYTWRIVKTYDYGSSHPWGCVWFAISDGSDYLAADGHWRPTIPGDIFAVYELYGWTGRRNEGNKETIQSQAEKIKLVESTVFANMPISQSIADSQIFASTSGAYCISDDFESNGVYWEKCNKGPGSRENGYKLMCERLIASVTRDGKPGIFWFSRCQNCLATIPELQMEKDGTDRVATGGASEDHLYDAHRYLLTADDVGTQQTGSTNNY